MKRIIKVILVLIVCLNIKTVYAENYELNDLIPYKIDTTVHADHFNYIGIYYDEEGVHFNGIRNLTKEELPISVSVGLFNKKRLNIGTINHCSDIYKLKGNSEMSYFIEFNDSYFGEGYGVKDVKYIAVLGDNITCRTKGSNDYIGKSIDTLKLINNNKIDSQTQLFLSILTILAGAFLVFIIYKLIFTRAYRNIDGKEVREAYDDINKELKKMREEKESNKVEILEEDTGKSKDLLKQEEEAKNEDKQGTDLHNLYK